MHEVLINSLGGLSLPRKSVVRLTDRPDMTLDVYRARKTTMQQQQPKAFNSRALTSENPCINNDFHEPLTYRYFTIHMQDSGQYFINTEEALRLQLKLSIKQLT